MRAAIVHGEHAALVVNGEDWAAPAAHHDPPLRLQLLDRPGADEIVLSLTHHKAPCARPGPIRKMGAAAAPPRLTRSAPSRPDADPWNKGKLIGPKPPLQPPAQAAHASGRVKTAQGA